MDFKEPYLLAMREQVPRRFNQLVRSGAMEAHLQEMSKLAHAMYEELASNEPKLPNGLVRNQVAQVAFEEIVRAELIRF